MRIKTGISVEELNGSAGGTTAARNKSRMYFKIRTAPRNPKTGAQTSVRGRLAGVSRAWGELTNEQRLQWDEWAKTQAGRRVLGKAGVLSGFNAYCRVNLNLSLIGEESTNVPPVNGVIGELTDIVVSGTAADGYSVNANMLMNGVPNETGKVFFSGALVIEMTPILKSGVASDVTALRVIGIGEKGATSGTPGVITLLRALKVSAPYAAKFGQTLKAGDKVQISVKAVSDGSQGDGTTGLTTLKITKVLELPELTTE